MNGNSVSIASGHRHTSFCLRQDFLKQMLKCCHFVRRQVLLILDAGPGQLIDGIVRILPRRWW